MWVHQKRRDAFTIVELLIVIVVIAILTAISIVAFNGIQNRARGAAASSALSQASKKLALWQIESGTNGASSADCSVFAVQVGSTINPQNACLSTKEAISYEYRQGTAGSYCITATNGNVSYKIDTTISQSPVNGGCAGHGQGGIGAATNIFTNPSFETISGTDVASVQSSTRATAETSTIGVQSGSRSVRVTPIYDASTDTFITISNPGLKINTSYTVLVTYTLQTDILSGGSGPRFRFNIGGVDMQSDGGSQKVAGTHTIRWNFSIGSSNSINFLRIMPGGKLGDPPVYFDNLMITEGTYTGAYFDGGSTNWTWNGTPHSATSTGPTN